MENINYSHFILKHYLLVLNELPQNYCNEEYIRERLSPYVEKIDKIYTYPKNNSKYIKIGERNQYVDDGPCVIAICQMRRNPYYFPRVYGNDIKKNINIKIYSWDIIDKKFEEKNKIINELQLKENILKTKIFKTNQDKLSCLENIDNLNRDIFDKMYNLKKHTTTFSQLACCLNFCPETERHKKFMNQQLNYFEKVDSYQKIISQPETLLVKDYTRSAADQNIPLPYELRTISTLRKLMNHLIINVFNSSKSLTLEWFTFIYDCMRSMRKEISQLDICDVESIEILEEMVRFHIFCSPHWIKMNKDPTSNDNMLGIRHSLGLLSEFYMNYIKKNNIQNLRNIGEFHSYQILLNINDEIEVISAFSYKQSYYDNFLQHALKLRSSFKSINSYKFFKYLQGSTLLSVCCLHKEIMKFRALSLNKIQRVYSNPVHNERSFKIKFLASKLFITDEEQFKEIFDKLDAVIENDVVKLNKNRSLIGVYDDSNNVSNKVEEIFISKCDKPISSIISSNIINDEFPIIISSFDDNNYFVGNQISIIIQTIKNLTKNEDDISQQNIIQYPSFHSISNILDMHNTYMDNTLQKQHIINLPSICKDNTFQQHIINVPSRCKDNTLQQNIINVPSTCKDNTLQQHIINVPSTCKDNTLQQHIINIPYTYTDNTLQQQHTINVPNIYKVNTLQQPPIINIPNTYMNSTSEQQNITEIPNIIVDDTVDFDDQTQYNINNNEIQESIQSNFTLQNHKILSPSELTLNHESSFNNPLMSSQNMILENTLSRSSSDTHKVIISNMINNIPSIDTSYINFMNHEFKVKANNNVSLSINIAENEINQTANEIIYSVVIELLNKIGYDCLYKYEELSKRHIIKAIKQTIMNENIPSLLYDWYLFSLFSRSNLSFNQICSFTNSSLIQKSECNYDKFNISCWFKEYFDNSNIFYFQSSLDYLNNTISTSLGEEDIPFVKFLFIFPDSISTTKLSKDLSKISFLFLIWYKIFYSHIELTYQESVSLSYTCHKVIFHQQNSTISLVSIFYSSLFNPSSQDLQNIQGCQCMIYFNISHDTDDIFDLKNINSKIIAILHPKLYLRTIPIYDTNSYIYISMYTSPAHLNNIITSIVYDGVKYSPKYKKFNQYKLTDIIYNSTIFKSLLSTTYRLSLKASQIHNIKNLSSIIVDSYNNYLNIIYEYFSYNQEIFLKNINDAIYCSGLPDHIHNESLKIIEFVKKLFIPSLPSVSFESLYEYSKCINMYINTYLSSIFPNISSTQIEHICTQCISGGGYIKIDKLYYVSPLNLIPILIRFIYSYVEKYEKNVVVWVNENYFDEINKFSYESMQNEISSLILLKEQNIKNDEINLKYTDIDSHISHIIQQMILIKKRRSTNYLSTNY